MLFLRDTKFQKIPEPVCLSSKKFVKGFPSLNGEALFRDVHTIMLDPGLLAILCCPETKQDLTEGSDIQIRHLNEAVTAGTVKNRLGQSVSEKVDGLLIRSDRQFAYPIRQDIPILLTDEAIPLSGLSL